MQEDFAPSTWDGTERRSAPLHLIRYVDERLRVHTERVDARLELHAQRLEKIVADHTADEIKRFSDIAEQIRTNAVDSQQRHDTLLSQLQSNSTRQRDIEQAFLRTHSGEPDFHGHREDHSARYRAGVWWSGIKDKTLTKVFEWAAVALIAWVGYALWHSFLKGPQG